MALRDICWFGFTYTRRLPITQVVVSEPPPLAPSFPFRQSGLSHSCKPGVFAGRQQKRIFYLVDSWDTEIANVVPGRNPGSTPLPCISRGHAMSWIIRGLFDTSRNSVQRFEIVDPAVHCLVFPTERIPTIQPQYCWKAGFYSCKPVL